VSFLGAVFDHTGISTNCVSCHTPGGTGLPKTATHLPTTQSCELCHKGFTTFVGAVMNHTGITANCVQCHVAGGSGLAKPATHIATTAPCENCHKSTLTFTGALFDHTGIVSGCASCHNGVAATGKSPTHFQTTVGCEMCHRPGAWTPVTTYTHTSALYPGRHSRTLACTDCHTTNAQTVPYRTPAYKPDCAGCHATNFKPDSHKKYGNVLYTVAELRNCAGACHEYTDATLSKVKTTRNSHHRVSDGSF
jgi:hypothetical protein